jgi:hypothetical protein
MRSIMGWNARARARDRDQIVDLTVYSNVTVPETDLVAQMRARVRRHLLVSLGGVALAMLCIGIVVGIAKALDPSEDPPTYVGILAFGCILMIPSIGFWSAFKNLRCPKCEGSVAWQVSANFSLFSAQATKHCRHCNEKIFPDAGSRRVLMIMIVVGVAFGAIGAIVNVLMSRGA